MFSVRCFEEYTKVQAGDGRWTIVLVQTGPQTYSFRYSPRPMGSVKKSCTKGYYKTGFRYSGKKPQTSAIIDFCLLKLRMFGGESCFRLRGAPPLQESRCWITCWGTASVMTDWSLVTSLMVWWRKGLTAGNDGATGVTRWSRPRTSGLDYLGVKIQNFGSTTYWRHSIWFIWDRISDNDYKTYETSVFLDLNLQAANNH